MPTRARAEEFLAMVQRGEFLRSMKEFYADDATAQENGEPPRVGLSALLVHEEQTLKGCRFDSIQAVSFVVDGDRVAIHWVFEMTVAAGKARVRLDEIAYQEWREEKIVRERFYY